MSQSGNYMLKNINNIKFEIAIVGLFLTFGFFDIIKFSVFDGGVDSGYYLSTARAYFAKSWNDRGVYLEDI
jgi:hypothetical protein